MRGLLTRTVDARPLALSRILIGLAALGVSFEWTLPLLRAADGEYLALPVIPGAPVVAAPVVVWLYLVAVLGAVGMVLGVFGPVAPTLVAASGAVALLADQQAYSNHALLLVLLAALLAPSGAHRAFSVRRRGRPPAQVPYWPAFLIRALLSSVYLWTAIAKVNRDYLAGDVFANFGNGLMDALTPVLPVLAIASIATELFLGIGLWVRPLFPLVLLAGAGLHVGILATLQDPFPLVLFALLMAPAYVLAGAEWLRGGGALAERTHDAWRRFRRRMRRRRPAPTA
ncbi:HTTM domain-containing protein [Agromyces sp. SYSU T00194]|uniref:HTTM domain-containing protein n=1 Tax=Agromyces chitinivorans TaxID=3158560 RepID=UPI00339AEF8E